MAVNEFRKALKGVDKAMDRASKKALTRAAQAAGTKLTRDLKEQLGVRSKDIKKTCCRCESEGFRQWWILLEDSGRDKGRTSA